MPSRSKGPTQVDAAIERARRGDIFHFRPPHVFDPLGRLFAEKLTAITRVDEPFHAAFSRLDPARLDSTLAALVSDLDASGEHLREMARILKRGGCSANEQLLSITLDKSYRLCLTKKMRRNYGYQAHRDEWFGLAPDGVNIILYMTDVPYTGNTIFFEEFFDVDLPWDHKERRLLDESMVNTRVTSFNCKAGDVLLFSGNHLHAGAFTETDRLSIEFRVSKLPGYGRPKENILYRPLMDFEAAP
jgi:hypothetical protein